MNVEFGWKCTANKRKGGDLTARQLLWIDYPISMDSDSNKCLTETHFCKLLDKLKKHAYKWRVIGAFLGIEQDELNTIEDKPLLLSSAPENWLGAMLTEWL